MRPLRQLPDLPLDSPCARISDLKIDSLAEVHAAELLNNNMATVDLPFSRCSYTTDTELLNDFEELLGKLGDPELSQKHRDVFALKERIFGDGHFEETAFFNLSVKVMVALTRVNHGERVIAEAQNADIETLQKFTGICLKLFDWAGEKIAQRELGV